MDGREGQFLIASWLVSLTVGRRPLPTLRRWSESSRLTITKPHNRSHILHTITRSPTFSPEHRATHGFARSHEVSRGGQEPQQAGSQPGSNCRSASDFSGLGRRGPSSCCVHQCVPVSSCFPSHSHNPTTQSAIIIHCQFIFQVQFRLASWDS